jgi:hypothetical protein
MRSSTLHMQTSIAKPSCSKRRSSRTRRWIATGEIWKQRNWPWQRYSGRVLPGKVLTTIDVASRGQLTATGFFPGPSTSGNARFAVRIRLDDADNIRLPAGAQGSAAVYTGEVQIAGVLRMALMRIASWTNYLYLLR